MIRLLVYILAALVTGLIQSVAITNAGENTQKVNEEVLFKWAFCALKENDGTSTLETIEGDTTLNTGDQLKMLLELETPCYGYVLYHGPRDEMRLLFPYQLSDVDDGLQVSRAYFIPRGKGWLELDDQTGLEVFHLIVSEKRLNRLERLIKDYETARPGNKQAPAKEIIGEIRRLQSKHQSLKAPAERPVHIVGSIRGAEKAESGVLPDIAPLAIEIATDTFFSRTFTIDHK